MIASSVAHRLALATAACITLVGNHRLQAQDTGLPESVRVALTRYADLDPLAVTWSETTEATPLGREKLAPEVLGKFKDCVEIEQFAFRDGRMYQLRKPSAENSVKSDTVEIAFDRNVLYIGDPTYGPKSLRGQPVLIKRLPLKTQSAASYFSSGYFQKAGVRLPSRVKEMVQSWHPQSELLALLSEGGRVETTGLAELDGQPLIRVQVKALDLSMQMPPIDLIAMERQLRSSHSLSEKEIQERLTDARDSNVAKPPQRRFDFYFDSKRDYAVRRIDTWDEAGRLLIRSDCTEHEQLTGRDIWLPRCCRVEKYTFWGRPDQVFASPLYVAQYRVSAFDLKPWPHERFELKYTTPGTRVNDNTFPEVEGKIGVNYNVPANPEQLDEAIAAARAKYQMQLNAERRSHQMRMFFLVFNGVCLVILVVSYVLRRRKKASST